MGERALKKWMIGVTLIAAGFILTACGNGQAKEDASWEKVEDKKRSLWRLREHYFRHPITMIRTI